MSRGILEGYWVWTSPRNPGTITGVTGDSLRVSLQDVEVRIAGSAVISKIAVSARMTCPISWVGMAFPGPSQSSSKNTGHWCDSTRFLDPSLRRARPLRDFLHSPSSELEWVSEFDTSCRVEIREDFMGAGGSMTQLDRVVFIDNHESTLIV